MSHLDDLCHAVTLVDQELQRVIPSLPSRLPLVDNLPNNHVRAAARNGALDAVIFLDWTGVDPSSNPLHPASKLFDSRSSMELQCIYILNIERLGVSVVL